MKGKDEEELRKLREQANAIDSPESPFKVIVSVLMLKEGWDARNVTTIVGLRAYSAKSNILPEQTLGRGLRRMFFGRDDIDEYVSVTGTPAFMELLNQQSGGRLRLEKRKMGIGGDPLLLLLLRLIIKILRKTFHRWILNCQFLPRIQREYKNLQELDVSNFGHKKISLKEFSEKRRKKSF